MFSRFRSGLALLVLLSLPVLSAAAELEGRGRTWELGADIGASFLDAGFDETVFGYTIQSTSKVPDTDLDNLNTTVPTLGFRAGYSFTRVFGLEFSVQGGRTEVGSDTSFSIQENFTLPPDIRKQIVAEQEEAVPGMKAALGVPEFTYLNGGFTSVFNFNNQPNSRFVWYVVLGGGYFSIDANTADFNDCNEGDAAIVHDPNIPILNGGAGADEFPDNPEQIRLDAQCGRAFLTGTSIGVDSNNDHIVVLGTRFQDSVPLMGNSIPNDDPITQDPGYFVNPETQQAYLDGEPLWGRPDASVAPQDRAFPYGYILGPVPGTMQDRGYRTFGTLNGERAGYYTAGGGIRWHFRPRQAVRIDLRRHFAESINKNINEVTFGYSFIVGKGKAVEAAAADLPPPETFPEPAADDELPPPADDSGDDAPAAPAGDDQPGADELPPPAGDDEPGGDELPPPAGDDEPGGDELPPPAGDDEPGDDELPPPADEGESDQPDGGGIA
jgi:hypothetical protein